MRTLLALASIAMLAGAVSGCGDDTTSGSVDMTLGPDMSATPHDMATLTCAQILTLRPGLHDARRVSLPVSRRARLRPRPSSAPFGACVLETCGLGDGGGMQNACTSQTDPSAGLPGLHHQRRPARGARWPVRGRTRRLRFQLASDLRAASYWWTPPSFWRGSGAISASCSCRCHGTSAKTSSTRVSSGGGPTCSSLATASRTSASISARSRSSAASSRRPCAVSQVRKRVSGSRAAPLGGDALVAIARRIVRRRVRRDAIGERLDQRRPFAAARAIDGVAHAAVDGEHVVAVAAHAAKAVGDRLGGHRRRRRLHASPASRSPTGCSGRRTPPARDRRRRSWPRRGSPLRWWRRRRDSRAPPRRRP